MAKHQLPPMFIDKEHFPTEVWVRLECNHYVGLSHASSMFDFPEETMRCKVCDESRHFKPYIIDYLTAQNAAIEVDYLERLYKEEE